MAAEKQVKGDVDPTVTDGMVSDVQEGTVHDNADSLHRRLGNRQIQLIAIGGSIGTAIFINIGSALAAGGPGSLLVAYVLYTMVLVCINNSIAEMTVQHPVSGGFIRLAGKWVDDALGFMVGWNFFMYEALLIPFEITALNLVLQFWTSKIPVAAVCVICIVLWGYVFSLTPLVVEYPPTAVYCRFACVNEQIDAQKRHLSLEAIGILCFLLASKNSHANQPVVRTVVCSTL